MEQTLNNLEQLEVAPIPVDNANEDSNLYGNFKSTQELAKAYENLHSEFTRKCQELAKLKEQSVVQVPTEVIDRGAIIADYLLQVQNQQTAPTVITSASGLGFGTKPTPKPLKECGALAEHYFKTKQN